MPVDETFAEMLQFNDFHDGGRLPIFLENFQFSQTIGL